MIGTIKLHTKSHETAQNLLFPLDKQLIALSDPGKPESAVGMQFDSVAIRRGAIETVFEILGKVDWGALSAGVATGVIANWIYALISKPASGKSEDKQASKPATPPLQVFLIHNTQTIVVDLSTRQTIEASIRPAFEDDKPGEPKGD